MAKESFKNQSKNYIVYPTCVPSSYNGECHVNHIRKMQASFSWDWGPAIPASGIWRDVELITVKDAGIMDQTVDVFLKENNEWSVNVTLLLELAPSRPITGLLEAVLIIENSGSTPTELISNSTSISITNESKQTTVSIVLNIPETKILRWWPNGYGDQKLYNLNITLTTPKNRETKTKRIGFRTVKLIQKPLTTGLSFYFEINSIPIFAKGSNMIPASIFPSKSENKTLREHLLRYTKEANMNMLRIWGGGIYETDYFYDIADEYGIMIWQDFMFACSMYPTTNEFLNSVKQEVIQNVWRLKNHVSIVIWAGNNENEAALYGNWYGTKDEKIYRDDYVKLYVDVIKREVEMLDSTRPFIVSSPTNGIYSDENEYVKTDPYSTLYGDIHYYNYLADGWDISTYKRPRFSSEYGFQSYPSIVALRSVSRKPQEDLVLGSGFLNHRQHLMGGNQYMKLLITKNLKIPETVDKMQDFENYVYLSQVNQAQSVKVQSESYRQSKSKINDASEGLTMGALYWQLNDVWPAPTWSSIDFTGRWKLLHHFAEQFFAPVIVSPRVELDNLDIFVVSDLLRELKKCTIDVNVHKIGNSSQNNVYTFIISGIDVGANEAVEVKRLRIDDLLHDASCLDKHCLIELVLRDQNKSIIAPVNYAYPVPPKVLHLPACRIVASFSTFADDHDKFYRKHRVIVQSKCIQLFVRFDTGGYFVGRFSENGFHMLENEKEIFFYIDRSVRIQDIIQTMTLVALGQIYQSPMVTNNIRLE